MHFELEALSSLAALAAVDVREAVAAIDTSRATADDYADPIARRVAGVIEARLRGGLPLEFVTLREMLGFAPTAPEAAALLEVLTQGNPGGALEHLSLIRARAIRRRNVDALRHLALLLRDETRPLESAISEAQSVVGAWAIEGDSAPTMETDLGPLVDELEAIASGQRQAVVPTGIEALDAVVGGLQPTLTVIGALPGVGKSALVAAIARNLARQGVDVGLVSLEDERGWLARRILADEARVSVHAMLTKPLTREQQSRVYDAAAEVSKLAKRIHIDGRGGLTAAEVVASARVMISRGAKAILVDHLGEVRVAMTDRHDLEVAGALSQLRALAKTYRVPMVVMSHLRRREGSGEYEAPRLTDFAFSAGVERMARVALGLFRVRDNVTGERDPEELRCAVLKQTQGAAGVVVSLRMNPFSAMVAHSPATDAARNLYREGA